MGQYGSDTLTFTPKITIIQELPGASPPPGLKTAPRPHVFGKKIHAPPTRIPGSAPDMYSYACTYMYLFK